MKTLYVIKAGTSFPAVAKELGDFDFWTIKALGPTTVPLEVIDVDCLPPLPSPGDCAGVVITGAHAMVTDNLDWSLKLEIWLRELVAAEVPVFGICYGHQLLARACGGVVGYHPLGKEIGTVAVERSAASDTDPLFKDLPNSFAAQVTHAQTVLELPPEAVRLAHNDFEPNHAFRIGSCAWGVQFHPEYETKQMGAYVQEQAEELCEAGRDIRSILNTIEETPVAAQLLRNFTANVENR
jgi:GMP synthase (glutamine-hydrolysing)